MLTIVTSRTGHTLGAYHFNGVDYRLDLRHPSAGRVLASSAPGWAASGMPALPRSQWVARSLVDLGLILPIKDQAQHGSCAGYASASTLTQAVAMAGGGILDFSGSYVYSLINGGRDAGAPIDDAAAALIAHGSCLESECGPESIWRSQTTRFDASAAQHKALDCYAYDGGMPFFDWVGTVLSLGFAAVVPVQVGPAFDRLDADGFPPVAYGLGNHAVCAAWLVEVGGRLVPHIRNSWTAAFGMDGYFNYAEAHAQALGRWATGYAIRAAAIDPSAPPWPAPIPA